MHQINLGIVDYAIMAIYVIFVVGIGYALKRQMKTSSDFLIAGKTIPTWVTGLAFISANLGALELLGMAASGAKYGIATAHFYWLGAIPAMVFLAVFMMPFYYGSKARSVPEYLKMRFDERVRALNSIAFAVMTLFASGISMNALAKLLNTLLGLNYHVALFVCSGVVLIYVLKGGLTSAIYTEVLQFFMIVLGFAPVVYLGLKDVGGWSNLKEKLYGVGQNADVFSTPNPGLAPEAWTSAWSPLLSGPSSNPMGVDWFAMVFGLGFVLSFGYWCTNFLVVQRAMAAKDMTAARRTPLVAAVPKMLFPVLVILPGMIAIALTAIPNKGYRVPPPTISEALYISATDKVKASVGTADPAAVVKEISATMGKKMDETKLLALVQTAGTLDDKQIQEKLYYAVAEYDYDGVILSLVKRYCPPGLLGLALTALLASFMSGMAGNVTAFNTVWTYDLYQAYIAKNKSDKHYYFMGQAITVVGIILSIGCAYFASMYNNAMDIIQLVFGFVNAPLFATFLLGMFWARCTGTAAFLGLFGGITASAFFHALTLAVGNVPGVKGGYLGVFSTFPSEMAQNFWLASIAFFVCLGLTFIISLITKQTKTKADLTGLVYSLTPKISDTGIAWYARPGALGATLLFVCIILNWYFW
jgi:solute:Na+ symporter, SSS family